MEAIVLKARISDINILNEICIESKMHWKYPADWIEKWMNDLRLSEDDFSDQEIFKIEFEGQTIGFCSIKENERNYEVIHLWIRPKYIGKGFGKMLLLKTIQNVVKKNKPIIVESDPNAEKFYASQGFVTFNKVESYPVGRFMPVMKKNYSNKK